MGEGLGPRSFYVSQFFDGRIQTLTLPFTFVDWRLLYKTATCFRVILSAYEEIKEPLIKVLKMYEIMN